MIGEGVVLLRIKYFKERRRRVPLVVVAQLLQLVQHEDRIVGAGLLQSLQDAPRQSADIGATVPPDLCFIAHPTQ